MRTRHDRATQLLLNCYDLGVGFRHEGDAVIALSPTPDGKGKPHPALQAIIDRYQPEFCELVPRHGVAPDRLLPATVAGATNADGDKMGVIRKGVESAAKNQAKKKSYGQRNRKPPARKPARPQWVAREIYEP